MTAKGFGRDFQPSLNHHRTAPVVRGVSETAGKRRPVDLSICASAPEGCWPSGTQEWSKDPPLKRPMEIIDNLTVSACAFEVYRKGSSAEV